MEFYHIDTLGDADDESLCILHDSIEGLGLREWKINKGKRALLDCPEDPKIFMSPKERGVKLLSLIGNTNSMLIVSRLFRESIERHCQGVEIEFLRFDLYDHRKRVRSRDYCIVNPIGTFDCLDERASGVKYGTTGKIIHVSELVFDREKSRNAPQLFRVPQRPSQYIVGAELARDIAVQEFTNVIWTKVRFSDEVGDDELEEDDLDGDE